MAGTTSAPADAMDNSAGDFSTAASTLNGEALKVRNAMDNLDVEWKGQAALTFKTAMEEWRGKFDKIHQDLENIARTLHDNANTVRQTEDDANKQVIS